MVEKVDAKGIISSAFSSITGFFRSVWDRLFKVKSKEEQQVSPSDEEVYREPEDSESGLKGQLVQDEIKEKLESSTLEQGVEYALRDEALNPAYKDLILRLYERIHEQENIIEEYKLKFSTMMEFDENKIKSYIRGSYEYGSLRGQEIYKFYSKLKEEYEKTKDSMTSYERNIFEQVLNDVDDSKFFDNSEIIIISKRRIGDVLEVVYSVRFLFIVDRFDNVSEKFVVMNAHESKEYILTIHIPISDIK